MYFRAKLASSPRIPLPFGHYKSSHILHHEKLHMQDFRYRKKSCDHFINTAVFKTKKSKTTKNVFQSFSLYSPLLKQLDYQNLLCIYSLTLQIAI